MFHNLKYSFKLKNILKHGKVYITLWFDELSAIKISFPANSLFWVLGNSS